MLTATPRAAQLARGGVAAVRQVGQSLGFRPRTRVRKTGDRTRRTEAPPLRVLVAPLPCFPAVCAAEDLRRLRSSPLRTRVVYAGHPLPRAARTDRRKRRDRVPPSFVRAPRLSASDIGYRPVDRVRSRVLRQTSRRAPSVSSAFRCDAARRFRRRGRGWVSSAATGKGDALAHRTCSVGRSERPRPPASPGAAGLPPHRRLRATSARTGRSCHLRGQSRLLPTTPSGDALSKCGDLAARSRPDRDPGRRRGTRRARPRAGPPPQITPWRATNRPPLVCMIWRSPEQ